MKQEKLGKLNERKVAQRALVGSLSGFLVFALAFVALPYILNDASALTASLKTGWTATSLELDPDYGNGSISDAGHGDVDFGTITPSAKDGANVGTMRVSKKTIGVNSSGKYYSVYLSMEGATDELRLASDSSIYIPAISGTWTAPASFDGAGWGYAVPKTQTSGTNTNSPFTTDYATTYDSLVGQDLTKTGTGSNVYNTGTWAAVPKFGSAQQIWTATTNNSYGFGEYEDQSGTSVTGDKTTNHFDVYYAAMVDSSVLAGEYSNRIVYTALASSQSLDQVSENLGRSDKYSAYKDKQTLTFDLAQSIAGLITKNDVVVRLVPHSVIEAGKNTTTNTYQVSSAMTADKDTYPTCDVDSISISTTGSNIICTMPLVPVENGTGNASYDFWLELPEYGANYISHYVETDSSNPSAPVTENVASVVYAGLQTYDPATYNASDTTHAFLIDEMQEMTASVCKNTNMWGSGTGAAATLYDNQGEASGTLLKSATNAYDLNITTYADGELPIASFGTTNDYYGTFRLVDSRDNKDYLVRRLADGECWMVQNLDLDLKTFANTRNLTADNTDLETSGRAYWDPSESIQAMIDNNGSYNSFADLALDKLGSAQTAQYQKGLQRNTNADPRYWWGSILNEDGNVIGVTNGACNDNNGDQGKSAGNNTGTVTGSYCVENNSRSAFPRSYDNGLAYIGLYRSGTSDANTYVRTLYKDASGNDINTPYSTANTSKDYYDNQTNGTTCDWIDTDGSPREGTGDGHDDAEACIDTTTTRDTRNHGTQYVGDYYNWYAATAESGTWETGAGSTPSATGTETNADDSICPKGWRLPVNGAGNAKSWGMLLGSYKNGEAATIGSNYQSANAMHLAPLSIPFSGNYYWVNGNLYNRGHNGNFWSSTAYASTNAHNLNFNPTNVNPQNGNNKTNGLTIRCVAR